MMTHSEAEARFKRCRNKKRGYLIAKHTRLQKHGHAFIVRYYETDVVIIRPDGKYRINSGKHRTVTTKRRMNMILPTTCRISQSNGIWYAGDAYYTDGMLIGPDGKAIGAKEIPNLKKIKNMVDRKISKFIRILSHSCIGSDIGIWEKYEKYTIPNIPNEIYLKKLWRIINTTGFLLLSNYGSYNLEDYYQLIYLAILSRGYTNPRTTWQFMRNDFLALRDRNAISVCSNSLRIFMRPRKPFMAEMIATDSMKTM